MDAQEAEMIHLSDQAWASLAEYEDDMERIARSGINMQRYDYDDSLVRKVFHTALGMMKQKRYEATAP